MFKRVAILLFCLMIVFIATFGFAVGVVTVPTIFAYAEDGLPTGYTPVTDDMEFAQSFNDYCKSRDAYFTSTDMGATYTYVYNYMKEGLGYLGYNIDELQEGLYKQVEGNTVARWYMNSTLMGAYNNLFAYLIRENDLEVGDAADLTVYSGQYYVDPDGIGCLVYVIPYDAKTGQVGVPTNITAYGTYYKYSHDDLLSMRSSGSPTFSLYNNTVNTRTLSSYEGTYNRVIYDIFCDSVISTTHVQNNIFGVTYQINTGNWTTNAEGHYCVVKFQNSDNLYLGTYTHSVQTYSNGNTNISDQIYSLLQLPSSSDNSDNVNIIFFSNQINNNNYEGDTIINNNGDIINNDPVTPGGNDPGWNIGGGQGQATDGNGNTWNITFPDFELPDLNIDWSIQGLGDKFPFSIPFDLVALVNVLNAEPEAPRFEGTVNFGFTTWDYDINLEPFDTVAAVCRTAELLLLVFGLILITRSIIKG